jgi:hypothetical protein
MSSKNPISDIPLPDVKFEKPRYVAIICYQIPRKIKLGGRRKVSPRFETMYGALYWLNKQDYNMDYMIVRTDQENAIRSGYKKVGEVVR